MATSNSAKIVKAYMSNKRTQNWSDYYNGLNYAMNEVNAQKQMDFQKTMSNTAHQREVQDLIAAGLNPILSANAGASTPNGAMGTVDTSAGTAKAQEAIQKRIQKQQYELAYQNDKKLQKLQANLDRANQRYLQKYEIALEKYKIRENIKNDRYLNDMTLAAQKFMNKYQTDLNYKLGIAQSQMGYNATTTAAKYSSNASKYSADRAYYASRYGSQQSYAAARYASDNAYYASLYGSDQAAAASRYSADQLLTNGREQRAYDNMHPNNLYNALGSLVSVLADYFASGGSKSPAPVYNITLPSGSGSHYAPYGYSSAK